jgi:class 3 adenylate cyclase
VHRLTIHAIVFVAVSALLTVGWLLSDGSEVGPADILSEPGRAVDLGFWPIFVIVAWFVVLVVHAVLTAVESARHPEPEPTSAPRELMEEGIRRTAEMAGGLLNAAVERGAAAIAAEEGEPGAPDVGQPRWVAVMFTDIADSTALTEQLGDQAWHELLTRHRDIVRRCIEENDGEEVATQGDGFFIRHDEIVDAIACAVCIQRTLDKRRHRDLPTLRIGIHAGEAVQDKDGDLMGHVVNVAARVADAAGDGEILVTESVADNAGPDVDLVDGGLRELKGVAQPRHVLRVDW